MCGTVHYAHSHGVLHRDLKPSNILLDRDGIPHVTDFGLAKCIEIETSLTQTGLILGTPAYMAPEQASRGVLTEAVDIYGLGAVLYKLLTGRPPFQAETMYEILDQIRDRPPASTRLYNRGIDRNLDAICLKCLEKDPNRRYHSAAALSADLESLARRFIGVGSAPCMLERLSRWYQQNRRLIAVSVALVGLVMVFVLAGVATATIICHYELADDLRPRVPASGLFEPGKSVALSAVPAAVKESSRTTGPARQPPAPGTLKLKCESLVQLTLPTIGGPTSCASVRRPFPDVNRPWRTWFFPFSSTLHTNRPLSRNVRLIVVSSAGRCAPGTVESAFLHRR